TWHSSPTTAIMNLTSIADYQVSFRFHGKSAHAASSPHLGRSALDALELMNVGVNYLREHVTSDVRFHYAVTNTGGISPNVVQADAEVLYLIRAPKIEQVKKVYQRIVKISKGAALMTETDVTIDFNKACSNYIPNKHLEWITHQTILDVGANKSDINYIYY